MFGARYFGARYFGPRYWGEVGATGPVVTALEWIIRARRRGRR